MNSRDAYAIGQAARHLGLTSQMAADLATLTVAERRKWSNPKHLAATYARSGWRDVDAALAKAGAAGGEES